MTDTAATPVTTQSTADIVQSTMADLPDDGGSELPSDTTEPESVSSGTLPGSAEERDELAEALGIAGAGKGRWTSRVAYSKLHKVIGERDKKTRETHEAALKQHTDRVASFEQQIAAFDQMVANPAALLGALAQVNPAYRQYGATPQPEQPTQFNSAADLAKYVQSQINEHVSQRLAPIEQERQAREQIARTLPVVQQQIAEAKQWPMFVESQTEILAALQKNPKIGLHAAYQSVVLPKLSASREQVRQQVIAELNARPHSTVAGSSVTGRTATDAGAPMDTSDIVREAMRGLK